MSDPLASSLASFIFRSTPQPIEKPPTKRTKMRPTTSAKSASYNLPSFPVAVWRRSAGRFVPGRCLGMSCPEFHFRRTLTTPSSSHRSVSSSFRFTTSRKSSEIVSASSTQFIGMDQSDQTIRKKIAKFFTE